MKKVFALTVAGLTLCALSGLVSAPSCQAGELDFIATAGPVAGTGYIGTAALGKAYSKDNPGANVTMIPGSDTSNPLRLENRDVDVAAETHVMAVCSREGLPPFKKKVGNISAIANLRIDSRMNIVVRADTGIFSLDQIKETKPSLRVATGPRGSGSEVVFKWILEEYGLSYKDITSWGGKLISNNFGDVANMAKDGQVDIMCWIGPGEAWFFTELLSSTALRWLPVDGEKADNLCKKYNLNKTKLTADMFNGKMGSDVPSVATSQQILCRADLSDEIAYRLTKAFSENAKDIVLANPSWATYVPETAWDELTHPLHPGAAKYYKEKGWLK